jgi:hypothetical protein
MTRRLHLAAALAAVALGAGSAPAQYDLPGARPAARRPVEDPKPVYKYELKPESGEFLVCVRSFLGETAGDTKPKELAEGLAEWIRSECRLYAFVHERGWLLRREQDKEKEAAVKAIRDYYVPRGATEEAIKAIVRKEVKLAHISDEYAVFVAPGKGTLKTFEEAGQFAKYVHKLPCPPADFCDAVVVGSSVDVARHKGEPQNPFPRALPGRNPTLPKKDAVMERPKADEFLMGINAGQPYSLIHKTKKDFTLVVQTYGTKLGRVFKPGEVMQANGRSDGEILERAAQQANALAKALRNVTPPDGPWDAYVLHTRYESFVCVGEYDKKDEDRLLLAKQRLAGWQFKDPKGQVVDTLMEQPMPAMIPRP